MPNYDYICEKCGHIKEVSHSIRDEPNIKCGECGGNMKINIGSNLSCIKFLGYGWPGEDIKKGARLKKSNKKNDVG